MLTEKEASTIAGKYAKDHGYSGVHLLSDDYMFSGSIESFVFALNSEPSEDSECPVSTGLPECLIVEKTLGNTFYDRLLID